MKIFTRLLAVFATTAVQAQIEIVDTAPGSNQISLSGTYMQDFDSLTGAGTLRPWTDNTTLPGWHSTGENIILGFGVAEGIYSLGYAGGQGDRALGAIGSPPTLGHLFAVSFQNLTASTLTSVSVTFDGEQWNRQAANPQRASSLLFAYQVFDAGTGVIYRYDNTGWTFVPSLDFTSPNATLNAGSMLDGNAPQNSVRGINATINGLALAPGQELWLSWGSYAVPLGTPSHGLGIDNRKRSAGCLVGE